MISASANVIPELIASIVSLAQDGRMNESRTAQIQALPLIRSLFSETNPGPVKAALQIMGRIPSDQLRLPLVPVAEKTRSELNQKFGA